MLWQTDIGDGCWLPHKVSTKIVVWMNKHLELPYSPFTLCSVESQIYFFFYSLCLQKQNKTNSWPSASAWVMFQMPCVQMNSYVTSKSNQNHIMKSLPILQTPHWNGVIHYHHPFLLAKQIHILLNLTSQGSAFHILIGHRTLNCFIIIQHCVYVPSYQQQPGQGQLDHVGALVSRIWLDLQLQDCLLAELH